MRAVFFLLFVSFACWVAVRCLAAPVGVPAGRYAHVVDSDGTHPNAKALVELEFSGGSRGTVKVHAVQPGETVDDTGTYLARGGRITIHFKEVEWKTENQQFRFDGCFLVLPFKALSSKPGTGTSTWRKLAPSACGKVLPIAKASVFKPLSAALVIITKNGSESSAIFATEKAVRIEPSAGEGKPVMILHADSNAAWTLDPAEKTYSVETLGPYEMFHRLSAVGLESGCTTVGVEQIAGHRCMKEVCRIGEGENVYTETRWAALDLGGFVIKDQDPLATIEFENIRQGQQDPSLFEVPAGYRKK